MSQTCGAGTFTPSAVSSGRAPRDKPAFRVVMSLLLSLRPANCAPICLSSVNPCSASNIVFLGTLARKSLGLDNARTTFARLLQVEQRNSKMTKYSFRLTYINARRPLRVDGLDTVGINARPPGSVARELIRGPTEAGRAIHGYYHEPPTTGHAANSFRLLHHYIVFRQISLRPERSGADRLHCQCTRPAAGDQPRCGYRPPGTCDW
jgi:hypothetical protein